MIQPAGGYFYFLLVSSWSWFRKKQERLWMMWKILNINGTQIFSERYRRYNLHEVRTPGSRCRFIKSTASLDWNSVELNLMSSISVFLFSFVTWVQWNCFATVESVLRKKSTAWICSHVMLILKIDELSFLWHSFHVSIIWVIINHSNPMNSDQIASLIRALDNSWGQWAVTLRCLSVSQGFRNNDCSLIRRKKKSCRLI